ncbi:lipopolysaccharide transport system ATP-binding protein [Microbacterium terrae]|uniref:Teichoic acids export ATP-binding protein TagH n=1 Tax=Microbacterium terrae TaxID=69369 RepID=A0A0M2H856_9MICO|nr:polysaccharide ABC transporter ATP-binding protein [Microbacterium terrae]KJL42710.1 Teichoic acids export ATP-binding protein TagH [Microbacterium terrae]MBP1078577.1 lipopolysaccharide transport system ATP-binding protein [Microbacterium terrae]GLJ97977.1 hypothetical protein GCM10017594_11740 [Microbacterium terrae]
MVDSAINVSDLSKSYRIQMAGERVDRITTAVFNRIRHPLTRTHYEDFDALKDVSFEIPWGEAVGIVGRNGAGKSTLLKILTRITAPTTGVIDLGGRVGSLLEVGTGFSGELTGRENIYQNGALLGMSRQEIKRRFDEIVDFSGVEKFLDVPVKRYSSGMYVRLAFSVAAHLDTEILAIDEVLAVGDAEFQRKSLAKMRDVARDGRTVLYVSHQMNTVTALCTSALFLDKGRLGYHGSVDGAISHYRDTFEKFQSEQQDAAARPGTGWLRLTRVAVTEQTQEPADEKVIEFNVGKNPTLVGKYFVSAHITDVNGAVVVQCDSRLTGHWFDPEEDQAGTLRIKNLWLKPGRYTVDMFVCQSGVHDAWEGADVIEVVEHSPYPELASEEALSRGMILADFDYEATR